MESEAWARCPVRNEAAEKKARREIGADRSSFHIWQAISIHDPTEDDCTSTWSPRGLVKPFDSSRYQMLPYFCSHHWQLAVFDTEDNYILQYDSFWPDGVDRFPFVVCPAPQLCLVYLHQHKILERWLKENGESRFS